MRPLVSGFLTGIILGDPVTGAIVGAQINVLYLGWIGAGGALPSDIALAGVVGTAIAITAGIDAPTAMALAVPVGLLGSVIWVTKMTLNTAYVRVAEKFASKGETNKFWIADVALPQAMLFLFSFIPCFILVYFGAEYIQVVLEFLGDKVVGVLAIIGGMLPAVGIALTLKSIFKGQSIPFFFLGFLLVQYFGLDMISVGFLAVILTLIYMQITNLQKTKEDNKPINKEAIESRYGLLDKKTIRKSWFNWIMFNQSNYNYERMQGTGFCHSMVPIINKLYPDNAEKRAERMKLQMQFFNTEPQWGACIVGLTAAFEEKKAQGLEEISDEVITSTKTGLMGPLAGIGDTIDGGVITPLLLSLFIGIAASGNLLGPIGYIIVEAAFMWSIYWFSYKLGYERGSDAILNFLESGKINQLILGASIMGCAVLGALVGNFVFLNLGINIPIGSGEPFNLQSQLFDTILPGMLPLLLTLGCYALLKKGWSSVKVILLVVAVGLVGGLLNIFA
jgi:PTS system mannose-specific IID component